MRAGRRRNRIVIQRKQAVLDEYGDEIITWVELATAFAAVFYLDGTEQRAAAQEQAPQPATFEIVSNEITRTIDPVDRISFGGGIWDIRSVNEIGLNEGVRITATRGNPV